MAWPAFEMGPDEVEIVQNGKQVTGSSDAFRSEVKAAMASGSFEATCP